MFFETLFQVCSSKYCSASQKVVMKLGVNSCKVVLNVWWLTFDYRSNIVQLKLTFLLISVLGTNSNLQTVVTNRIIVYHLWPAHALRWFWKLVQLIRLILPWSIIFKFWNDIRIDKVANACYFTPWLASSSITSYKQFHIHCFIDPYLNAPCIHQPPEYFGHHFHY